MTAMTNTSRNRAPAGQPMMGVRIAALRKKRGWSQAELGRRVGRPRQTVNQWESGWIKNVRNPTFCKLASALGVSEDYLANGRGDANSLPSDKTRIDFLERMGANAQLNSERQWVIWFSERGRASITQASTLREAIDSAMNERLTTAKSLRHER